MVGGASQGSDSEQQHLLPMSRRGVGPFRLMYPIWGFSSPCIACDWSPLRSGDASSSLSVSVGALLWLPRCSRYDCGIRATVPRRAIVAASAALVPTLVQFLEARNEAFPQRQPKRPESATLVWLAQHRECLRRGVGLDFRGPQARD